MVTKIWNPRGTGEPYKQGSILVFAPIGSRSSGLTDNYTLDTYASSILRSGQIVAYEGHERYYYGDGGSGIIVIPPISSSNTGNLLLKQPTLLELAVQTGQVFSFTPTKLYGGTGTWSATRLPAGYSIDPVSGTVTGIARSTGFRDHFSIEFTEADSGETDSIVCVHHIYENVVTQTGGIVNQGILLPANTLINQSGTIYATREALIPNGVNVLYNLSGNTIYHDTKAPRPNIPNNSFQSGLDAWSVPPSSIATTGSFVGLTARRDGDTILQFPISGSGTVTLSPSGTFDLVSGEAVSLTWWVAHSNQTVSDDLSYNVTMGSNSTTGLTGFDYFTDAFNFRIGLSASWLFKPVATETGVSINITINNNSATPRTGYLTYFNLTNAFAPCLINHWSTDFLGIDGKTANTGPSITNGTIIQSGNSPTPTFVFAGSSGLVMDSLIVRNNGHIMTKWCQPIQDLAADRMVTNTTLSVTAEDITDRDNSFGSLNNPQSTTQKFLGNIYRENIFSGSPQGGVRSTSNTNEAYFPYQFVNNVVILKGRYTNGFGYSINNEFASGSPISSIKENRVYAYGDYGQGRGARITDYANHVRNITIVESKPVVQEYAGWVLGGAYGAQKENEGTTPATDNLSVSGCQFYVVGSGGGAAYRDNATKTNTLTITDCIFKTYDILSTGIRQVSAFKINGNGTSNDLDKIKINNTTLSSESYLLDIGNESDLSGTLVFSGCHLEIVDNGFYSSPFDIDYQHEGFNNPTVIFINPTYEDTFTRNAVTGYILSNSDVNIQITGSNPPQSITPTSFAVTGNTDTSTGWIIGQASVNTGVGGNWLITSSGDGNSFSIDSNGYITMTSGILPNSGSYNFVIRAYDNNIQWYDQTATLNIQPLTYNGILLRDGTTLSSGAVGGVHTAVVPNTVQSGDEIILFLSHDSRSRIITSPPSGFNLIATDSGTVRNRSWLYSKTADGTETGVDTTFNAGSTNLVSICSVTSGAAQIYTSGTKNSNPAGATRYSPDLNIENNSLVLRHIGVGYPITATLQDGVDVTGVNFGPTFNGGAYLSYRGFAAGGTTGSGVFTVSPTWHGEGVMFAIALTGAPVSETPSFGYNYNQLLLEQPSPIIATTGQSVNQAISTRKSNGTVTYSVNSSTLPPGISLSGNSLVGTPTTTGYYKVEVTANNNLGYSDTIFAVVSVNTGTINIDSSWLSANRTETSGVAFADVDNVVYKMQTSITGIKDALCFRGTNQVLEMNGQNITFAHQNDYEIYNNNFEFGTTGWDLSAAIGASVKTDASYLNKECFNGTTSLEFSLVSGQTKTIATTGTFVLEGSGVYGLAFWSNDNDNIAMTGTIGSESRAVSRYNKAGTFNSVYFYPSSTTSGVLTVDFTNNDTGTVTVYLDRFVFNRSHSHGITRHTASTFAGIPWTPNTTGNSCEELIISNTGTRSYITESYPAFGNACVFTRSLSNLCINGDIEFVINSGSVNSDAGKCIYTTYSSDVYITNGIRINNQAQAIKNRELYHGHGISAQNSNGKFVLEDITFMDGPGGGLAYTANRTDSNFRVINNTGIFKARYTNGFLYTFRNADGTGINIFADNTFDVSNEPTAFGRFLHLDAVSGTTYVNNVTGVLKASPNNQEYGGYVLNGTYGIEPESRATNLNISGIGIKVMGSGGGIAYRPKPNQATPMNITTSDFVMEVDVDAFNSPTNGGYCFGPGYLNGSDLGIMSGMVFKTNDGVIKFDTSNSGEMVFEGASYQYVNEGSTNKPFYKDYQGSGLCRFKNMTMADSTSLNHWYSGFAANGVYSTKAEVVNEFDSVLTFINTGSVPQSGVSITISGADLTNVFGPVTTDANGQVSGSLEWFRASYSGSTKTEEIKLPFTIYTDYSGGTSHTFNYDPTNHTGTKNPTINLDEVPSVTQPTLGDFTYTTGIFGGDTGVFVVPYHNDGDLMILLLQENTSYNWVSGTPSGWEPLDAIDPLDKSALYYRIANSEPSQYVFSLDSLNAGNKVAGGFIQVVSGSADPAVKPIQFAISSGTTAVSNVTPNYDTSLQMIGVGANRNTLYTAPVGFVDSFQFKGSGTNYISFLSTSKVAAVNSGDTTSTTLVYNPAWHNVYQYVYNIIIPPSG